MPRSSKREPANKGKRYPASKLTREEFGRLLGAIDYAPERPSSTALRNRALLIVLYRGALRSAEALNLKPADVNLTTGEIHVRQGKGERARVVAIDKGAVAELARWMERRRTLGVDGRKAYLFCVIRKSSVGRPLATSYLRRLLPKLADRAELGRRVHPHMLRHSRAAELADEGVTMPVVRDALGHSSLSTTDAYLRTIAPAAVIDAMRGDWKAPPAK